MAARKDGVLACQSVLEAIPWETRNLGVQSFALSADAASQLDAAELTRQIQALADEHGAIFVQAHIDRAHAAALPVVGSAGFYFIETAINPHTALQQNARLDEFERAADSFLRGRYEPDQVQFLTVDANEQAQCQAIRQIAGSSITLDRFHLDPNCDNAIADRRYQLWIDQMLSEGDKVFHLLNVRDEPAGFMVRAGSQLLLAGFARHFTQSGLGDYLWLSTLAAMRREDLTHCRTTISANNTGVLNLYARLGFRFRDPTAVFHYWHRSAT